MINGIAVKKVSQELTSPEELEAFLATKPGITRVVAEHGIQFINPVSVVYKRDEDKLVVKSSTETKSIRRGDVLEIHIA